MLHAVVGQNEVPSYRITGQRRGGTKYSIALKHHRFPKKGR